MNTTTPLERAIEAAAAVEDGSGIARIAAACSVSKQFIHKLRRLWKETGAPPRALRDHAPAIERACGGAVTADELVADVVWHRDARGAIVGYCVAVAPLAEFAEALAANDDIAPAEENGNDVASASGNVEGPQGAEVKIHSTSMECGPAARYVRGDAS